MQLYQRISLNRNFPEYHLKKGDLATFIDTVPHPTQGVFKVRVKLHFSSRLILRFTQETFAMSNEIYFIAD